MLGGGHTGTERPPIGHNLPKGRAFAHKRNQHRIYINVTGLAPATKLNQRAYGLKANSHSGKHAKQRGLHERAPMINAMLHTHAHEPLNQSEAYKWTGI